MTEPLVPPSAGPDPTTDTTTTATPVSTTPVAPPPTGTPRRTSRTRWLAALLVVALVAAGTAFAAINLTGASPAATVTGYVPADSVMYGEVRLDLPGDQRAEIGEFLSKFPGFADQAALDTKLDEVLDRLVSEKSEGTQTFTQDIKPWFDGEIAFAVGPLPDLAALGEPAAAPPEARGLILLSVKDEALARAWFADVMSESGLTGTPQTYEGTELTVFSGAGKAHGDAAFALVGGTVAVAGDVTSVKAAVDTKGASAFANDPDVAAAMAAVEGDHVGFMFIDLRSVVDSALAIRDSMASAMPVGDAVLQLVPDWASFRLRVEGDALVMDGAMPDVEGAPGPDQNRANGVTAWAPPTTLALATGNDYGATLLETVGLYRADPDPTLGEVFRGIDQAAGMLGGLDAAVGWMGDSGLVISQGADAPEGGLIAIPTDPAAARQLFTTLRSFATLGGGQAGITVREEDHNGTTITIIDLGDIGQLAGMAGGALPVEGAPALPFDGRAEVAYAVTDQVVVLGSGPGFVRSVLDAGSGASLADDARFRGLVDRVGAEHTGLTFIDIAAVRGLVEGLLSQATPAERAEYEESVKPFLTPFDAFIGSTVAGAEVDMTHGIITVK